jgi:hypothetical protein
MLELGRDSLLLCTNPTQHLNRATTDEIQALDRLAEEQCSYGPWLLGISLGTVRRGMHIEGIAGGYLAFQLMTKLPAVSFCFETFCRMDVREREEVRQAFKRLSCKFTLLSILHAINAVY